MQVVLLERVEKLGNMGEVVAVRPGYARNYLIPQGKAQRASKENIARFEAERSEREAQNAERRRDAADHAAAMEGAHVVLIRQASDNLQLYGSVKARDIVNGLIAQGFEVERQAIALEQPIKTLGLHPVRVMLHPEVAVTVTANVARSEDEAAVQKELGRAVGRGDEEDEEAPEIDQLVEADVAQHIHEEETAEEAGAEEESAGT
jgi:large subunit ribosomal protein L9